MWWCDGWTGAGSGPSRYERRSEQRNEPEVQHKVPEGTHGDRNDAIHHEPDHQADVAAGQQPIDDLDQAIIGLTNRINAATYELLVLVRQFDQRVGEGPGVHRKQMARFARDHDLPGPVDVEADLELDHHRLLGAVLEQVGADEELHAQQGRQRGGRLEGQR